MLSSRTAGLCQRLLSSATKINNVSVIGCGLMGSGIVQVAAQAGYKVTAFESNQGALDKGLAMVSANVERTLASKVKRGKLSEADAAASHAAVMSNIQPATEAASLSESDIVIEAIVEDMGAKLSLFSSLQGVVRADTIFATNTSSLSVGKMGAALEDASRVVGLHFFNPVPMMPLCEVVRAAETSDDTFQASREFAERCGKTTIACTDSPGFVVNRILIPTMVTAANLVDRGVANPRDIDIGMKLGAGWPMGVMQLADYVGLDTLDNILRGWQEEHPDDPAFQTPKCLKELVDQGKFGRKTGEGFYKWDGDKVRDE